MRWPVLAVLLQVALCAGISKQTGYLRKNITQCPDVGYFFERVSRPNAIQSDCQLCFCKEGDFAICWRREGNRCKEKEALSVSRQRRAPGFFNTITNFFDNKRTTSTSGRLAQPLRQKGAPRPNTKTDHPDLNKKCMPFSSYSKDCPPADWCKGCTVCECDEKGKWDCHILSFCSDDKGKPTKNARVNYYYSPPNTSKSQSDNIRSKIIPKTFIKLNPSQTKDLRKSPMPDKVPDMGVPVKMTARNGQIQGQIKKQLQNQQASKLKINTNIVRSFPMPNKVPDMGVPLKRTARKGQIQGKIKKQQQNQQASKLKRNTNIVRSFPMPNKVPDMGVPVKRTARKGQIQGQIKKQQQNQQASKLKRNTNIMRSFNVSAAKIPRFSNKIPIKNSKRKFKMVKSTPRIPPLNLESSEVQTVLKKFITNVRKICEKNVARKKPLRIGKVTQKKLLKIRKPNLKSKSKAIGHYTNNSKAGPCQPDGKQLSWKLNRIKLKAVEAKVKNKNNQVAPKRESKSYIGNSDNPKENEYKIRAYRPSRHTISNISRSINSENTNKLSFQHNNNAQVAYKQNIRNERASRISKQEIVKKTNTTNNPESDVSKLTLRNYTSIARPKRKVNYKTIFEHKNNFSSPENMQDNFKTQHLTEKTHEFRNDSVIGVDKCNKSLGPEANMTYIPGTNFTAHIDLPDVTDATTYMTAEKQQGNCELHQNTTEKIRGGENNVSQIVNDVENVLRTKSDDIAEHLLLFPEENATEKKNNSLNFTSQNSIPKFKINYTKESNQRKSQITTTRKETTNNLNEKASIRMQLQKLLINLTISNNLTLSAKNISFMNHMVHIFKYMFAVLKRSKEKYSNQNMNLEFNKRAIIKAICHHVGPCKLSRSKRGFLSLKIQELNNEMEIIYKTMIVIRTNLQLVNISKKITDAANALTANNKTDALLSKLDAILEGTYYVNETKVNSKYPKTKLIDTIKRNIRIFIRAVTKFASILKTIINILTKNYGLLNNKKYHHNIPTKAKYTKSNIEKYDGLEQVFGKIKSLLRKHKLMQNEFLRELHNVIDKYSHNITSLSSTRTKIPSDDGEKRGEAVRDIDLSTTIITENINKLKKLAHDMKSHRSRSKRQISDEVSMNYLLIVMEYLMKNKYMANSPPVNDGLDVLEDAIRNAPDINLTKQKFLESKLAPIVHSTSASSPFRSLTTPEERNRYITNKYEPTYIKESARKKKNRKMEILEEELKKVISEQESEKEVPEQDLSRRIFEKVLERTPKPVYEIQNKSAIKDYFDVDDGDEADDEDDVHKYFRVMRWTKYPEATTKNTKGGTGMNVKFMADYYVTAKEAKGQARFKSNDLQESFRNDDKRRNEDAKGNEYEHMGSNDAQTAATHTSTIEDPSIPPTHTISFRTKPPKTKTKQTEVTTVRHFNFYKDSEAFVDEKPNPHIIIDKLIWTDEEIDTKSTAIVTTTQAYHEQKHPSRKRKKHKVPAEKLMLRKRMNLLKSLEYELEDFDSSETRHVTNKGFPLY